MRKNRVWRLMQETTFEAYVYVFILFFRRNFSKNVGHVSRGRKHVAFAWAARCAPTRETCCGVSKRSQYGRRVTDVARRYDASKLCRTCCKAEGNRVRLASSSRFPPSEPYCHLLLGTALVGGARAAYPIRKLPT